MAGKDLFFSCVAALAMALAGCAAPPPPSQPYDPDEVNNRQRHEFNKALDRSIVQPLSGAIGGKGTGAIGRGVANFSDNLDVPGDVVNNILQLRLGRAAENTLRFVINTTIGLGGVLDPAKEIGLGGKTTDFGETLHVWGVPEGAYQELPFIGPSTDRDTVGKAVDVALNPLRFVLPARAAWVPTVASVGSRLGDRARFSSTVDSILYDSADSYAQTRLLYLQNRRFELGQTVSDDDFFDPYAEE